MVESHDIDGWASQAGRLQLEVERLTRERDEARAEVERLRALLDNAANYVEEEIAIRERDEARALGREGLLVAAEEIADLRELLLEIRAEIAAWHESDWRDNDSAGLDVLSAVTSGIEDKIVAALKTQGESK